MFGTLLTVGYTALLSYTLWRASSVPVLQRRVSRRGLLAAGVLLWALFLLDRMARGHTGALAGAVEAAAMILLGWVFLTAMVLLAVDLATAFGLLFRRQAPRLRALGLLAGALLSALALVQGLRPPAIVSHEVTLPCLPAQLEGKVLVAVSDAHVGTRRGASRLGERVSELAALRPDLVVFLGDMFEGHAELPEQIPALQRLSPPLGKWSVDGNHERHGAANAGNELLRRAGFRRLAGRWAEPVPGLILAGVQDLTHHRRSGGEGDPLGRALAGRPAGVTVLLSHTPWEAKRAARAGVVLMLSGHTHGGQIWPFGYLVQLFYPLLAGRYDVEGMTAIVGRGLGSWGPPMRLWHRSEVLRVTLRRSGRSCP